MDVVFKIIFREVAVSEVDIGWFNEVRLAFCSHFNCLEEV